MENYRRLEVSYKAKALAILVYRVTEKFPRSELYGMTSQLRRAAAGTGLAIAEGCGRNSTRDLIRFLNYSAASAQELEYGSDLSIDLELGPAEELEAVMAQSVELQKMLRALIGRLRERD